MTRRERLSSWLEERTGVSAAWRAWADRPVPGGARWCYALGPAVVMLLVVEIVTGLLLMTSYAPSLESAWASVHYISFAMSGGWIVRGVHRFASDVLIVLVALAVAQGIASGSYRRPREVAWWLGLVLLGVVAGFAVTGSLLPWDQTGYWARRVETNILGSAPALGPLLQSLVQGGASYGSLTLARFYALHVGVLPLVLVSVLWARGALVRKHGHPAPLGSEGDARAPAYYPSQVARNVVLALAALALVFALVVRRHGAPLDAPADPTSDYPARPEWFLLWIFRLLHPLGGRTEGVVAALLPLLIFAYLFLLPFLDRGPKRGMARLAPLLPAIALLVAVIGLTALSVRDDAKDAAYQRAKGKAVVRAAIAVELAKGGVPPAGPLAMLRSEPALRGEELFAKNCAACHVLSGLGDESKASAPVLDGWGTTAWIAEMLHDPDGHARFGLTPYKGDMPSMDVAPKDRRPEDPPFKAMTKDEMQAVATFLSAEGGAEGNPGATRTTVDEAVRKAGETLVSSRCTACHLFKGEGDDGDQGLAPELSGYGSVGWTRAQIANPTSKQTYRPKAVDDAKDKGHMPGFAEELSTADIDLLARWTRARARGIPMAAAFAPEPASGTNAPPEDPKK